MKPDIFYDERSQKWGYRMKGAKSIGFKTKDETARAYITMLLSTQPKYKPLLAGKTWTEIFRIMGIED